MTASQVIQYLGDGWTASETSDSIMLTHESDATFDRRHYGDPEWAWDELMVEHHGDIGELRVVDVFDDIVGEGAEEGEDEG